MTREHTESRERKAGPTGDLWGRWCSVQLGSLGVLGSICPEPSWAHCRSQAFAPASDCTVEQKRFHEYVRRCLGCRHMVVSMSGGWTTSVASTRPGTQGQTLGVQGVLAEVRGDWKFMKDTFGFPGWNPNSGICWLCDCTPQTLRDVGHERQSKVTQGPPGGTIALL